MVLCSSGLLFSFSDFSPKLSFTSQSQSFLTIRAPRHPAISPPSTGDNKADCMRAFSQAWTEEANRPDLDMFLLLLVRNPIFDPMDCSNGILCSRGPFLFLCCLQQSNPNLIELSTDYASVLQRARSISVDPRVAAVYIPRIF